MRSLSGAEQPTTGAEGGPPPTTAIDGDQRQARSSALPLSSTTVTGGDARGMPSLHSLVVRRAPLTDMGTATSSITSVNPPAKVTPGSTTQKKIDKAKLGGIKLPLLRKEASVINLSLTERTTTGREADAPLLRPESSASLEVRAGGGSGSSGSWISLGPGALRKCETAVGLSTSALEGRPINRSRVCSRCSSLLSLASSSRYSLAAGNFVPAGSQQTIGRIFCKLCLVDTSLSKTFKIEGCGCSYCKDVSLRYKKRKRILEIPLSDSCLSSACVPTWSSRSRKVRTRSVVPMLSVIKALYFPCKRFRVSSVRSSWRNTASFV